MEAVFLIQRAHEFGAVVDNVGDVVVACEGAIILGVFMKEVGVCEVDLGVGGVGCSSYVGEEHGAVEVTEDLSSKIENLFEFGITGSEEENSWL
jgi:hypothetical protein